MNQPKTETTMPKDPFIEVRSCREIRAIGEDGTFEGYITKWDTVDSYDSTFLRGSFKKTIQERGKKIKVFFDHNDLIGKSIEVREDDIGVFVRGQLSLGVEKARDTYEFMKDKTLDALSFGFRTIKDKWVNGVREISEVRLFEYGPVVFEANENAVITDVRAENIIEMSQPEKRDTDFNRTKELQDLSNGGGRLMRALDDTLWDIWYSGNGGDLAEMAEQAIADFKDSYTAWIKEFVAEFMSDEQRTIPAENELAGAFHEYLTEDENRTIDSLAMNTIFTLGELRSLQRGQLIDNREKLSEMPEAVRAAHNSIRNAAVETLCDELRAGLSTAEQARVQALLDPAEQSLETEPDLTETIGKLKDFRKSLNPENGE